MKQGPSRRDVLWGAVKGVGTIAALSGLPGESAAAAKNPEEKLMSPERKPEIQQETDIIVQKTNELTAAYGRGDKKRAQEILQELKDHIEKARKLPK